MILSMSNPAVSGGVAHGLFQIDNGNALGREINEKAASLSKKHDIRKMKLRRNIWISI